MNALNPALPVLKAASGPATPTGSPAEGEPAFSDALQQARQPPSVREARPDRAREGRSPEARRPAREEPADARPAGQAADGEATEPGTDADDSAATGPADAALPPWLELALARTPRADGAATRVAPETGPATPRGREAAAAARGHAVPSGAAPATAASGAAAASVFAASATASAASSAAASAAAAATVARTVPDAAADGAAFAMVLQQATGDAPRTSGTEPLPTLQAGMAGAASGLAGAGVAVPAGAAAQEPAAREIAAPLQSPEFAPALGAQLNLLIKDGVTEARLHLNPAEMGPITVQIQIEGQTARVEMAAEQAVTRQVLEQAMPVLAGALRDSGLTRAGGGVFEQAARDPRQDDADAAAARAARGADVAGGEPDPATELRAVAVPQGVVDLYA